MFSLKILSAVYIIDNHIDYDELTLVHDCIYFIDKWRTFLKDISNAVREAIKHDDLVTLQFLERRQANPYKRKDASYARVLQKGEKKQHTTIDYGTLIPLAQSVEVLDYLLTKKAKTPNLGFLGQLYFNIARSGQKEMLDYMITKKEFINWEEILIGAAFGNQLDLFELAENNEATKFDGAINAAAKGKHKDLFFRLIPKCSPEAIFGGAFELELYDVMLTCLQENPTIYFYGYIEIAIMKNNLEMVKFLDNQTGEWTILGQDFLEKAMTANSPDIVSYYLKVDNTEFRRYRVATWAAKIGYPDLLKEAITPTEHPLLKEFIYNAARNGNEDVLRLLIEECIKANIADYVPSIIKGAKRGNQQFLEKSLRWKALLRRNSKK
jgi:hypothetical protein